MHEGHNLRSCVVSSLLFFVSRQELQILPVPIPAAAAQRRCFANEYKKAQIQTSASVSVPRRRILNTLVFYHHKGRMSRKQAVLGPTNCPFRAKKSEKKVKMRERPSSYTCKMRKRVVLDS